MNIKPSASSKGVIGIFGHAGVGHVHSHLGFVQDDSAGLAVVTSFLKKAFPANTVIERATVDHPSGAITVVTAGGGKGTGRARRGITPFEAELVQRAVGLDAQYSQAAAFKTFGRIYGQGAMETAVAMQAAAALAVIDTFERNWPDKFLAAPEDIPGNMGRMIAAILDFDGIPVALLAVVNATTGGLGPDEDLEGNVSLGAKGRLMNRIGLDAVPGIVVESKPYVPGICGDISESTFWIRANASADNCTVAACLAESALEKNLPYLVSDSAFPRGKNELALSTSNLGKKIANIGMQLSSAATSRRKVELVGKLAEIISQDAGGVTFMSDALHNVVSGAGTVPGTAAVISLLVTKPYIEKWKIPMVTPEDVNQYTVIIEGAVKKLAAKISEAQSELKTKSHFHDHTFASLFEEQGSAIAPH
ncbi:MAG: hypothetical protein JW925_12345 [Syntrophaceae bacterium]|nr:hypothetical protein [Syntrophaceae bacterium]